MEGAREVGYHETSMLQDLEAGRPMELESVVGVVIERGDKLGLPMPLTRTLYSCTRLLEQVRRQGPDTHHFLPMRYGVSMLQVVRVHPGLSKCHLHPS